MPQFQLYDGVTIPPEGSLPSMTGVVVYKQGEQIGIRLTGDAEGMGDHCGDVDGLQLFDGGVNSGVLTTCDKVEGPRKLTFAEENLVRTLLQPKPAYSTSMASSMPMSGLSPAALARMMQLNQRMGVQTPTSAASTTPRNKLPPYTTPPKNTPPVPQLSDPPTVKADDKSPPALTDEKPPEKKLSRLEILRQKKEAIRKRKLELSKKVEETKKEKLQQQQQQQQQQEQERKEEQQQQEEAPAAPKPQKETTKPEDPAPSPKSVSSQKSTSSKQMPPPPVVVRNRSDTSMQDDGVASVKSKESSMFSKASVRSRDSIEDLWIHEVRKEAPTVAARYDLEDAENLLLEEDEEEAPESTRSMQVEGILRQPELLQKQNLQKHDGQDENDKEEPTRNAPMRQSSLSRLQQLRQKKRLLEALPASIQTPVAPPVVGHSNHDNLATFPEESRAMVQDRTDDEEEDDNDSKTTTSALSEMEDDKHAMHDDAVPAAFQESVTITSTTTQAEQDGSHKRRRMLGLGFLPGMNRGQKRQKSNGQ